jgi:hypothetical protein
MSGTVLSGSGFTVTVTGTATGQDRFYFIHFPAGTWNTPPVVVATNTDGGAGMPSIFRLGTGEVGVVMTDSSLNTHEEGFDFIATEPTAP